jgi:hypothetical protein
MYHLVRVLTSVDFSVTAAHLIRSPVKTVRRFGSRGYPLSARNN